MSQEDDRDQERLVALAQRGPPWQELAVGARVRRIGFNTRSKRGTVVEILERQDPCGVTMHIGVRWDRSRRYVERWGTDCLIVVDEEGETE